MTTYDILGLFLLGKGVSILHKKLRYSVFSLVIAGSALLAGCGGKETAETHHTASGDLQEVTRSLNNYPSFLDGLSEPVKMAYEAAAKTTDILPYIPCYCGCGEHAGHESNMNCFIHEIREDGSVVWDDHGTRCGVCIDIAVTASVMKEKGKTAKEIRQYIDVKYKQGYGKPTPTPMPA
jgi:hypothetical protein